MLIFHQPSGLFLITTISIVFLNLEPRCVTNIRIPVLLLCSTLFLSLISVLVFDCVWVPFSPFRTLLSPTHKSHSYCTVRLWWLLTCSENVIPYTHDMHSFSFLFNSLPCLYRYMDIDYVSEK